MPPEDTRHDIFEAIDESLRTAYEELLNEELPDRFVVLIQRLRERRQSPEGSPDDTGAPT